MSARGSDGRRPRGLPLAERVALEIATLEFTLAELKLAQILNPDADWLQVQIWRVKAALERERRKPIGDVR